MGSIIFVHGIGVRNPSYEQTFAVVEREVAQRLSGYHAVRCYWGGTLGARLRFDGRSIPTYTTARGPDEVDAGDAATTLWRVLYDDPYFELRILAGRPRLNGALFRPDAEPPLGVMDAKLNALRDPSLIGWLAITGLAPVWPNAVSHVVRETAYREALTRTDAVDGEICAIVARALVAEAIRLDRVAFETENAEGAAPVGLDGKRRDGLVSDVVIALGDVDHGIFSDWARKQLYGLAARLGTGYLERKRGAVSDAAYPLAGDTILYQARGSAIREFIRAAIETAPPPRIVLGHSLGGVACVDLFVERPITDIHAFVTVGSQAPFFFEVGALASLGPEARSLPDHFPARWINFYDLRDFLSYIGRDIFPHRIWDICVDNGQPFPESHGAYFENDDFWERLTRSVSA